MKRSEDYYTLQGVYPYKLGGKPVGWQARFSYRDAAGNRRQQSKKLESRLKRDALVEAKALLAQKNKDAKTVPSAVPRGRRGSSPTISEVVRDYLDFQLNKGEIEQSTYSAQMTRLSIYIDPLIGDYVFSEVDKIVLDNWVTKLFAKGLSSNTIHTVYALLNKVYRYHYIQGAIKENPCDFVRTPKKDDAKATYLDERQVKYLLECRDRQYKRGDYMWTALGLALYGGLRREEICGLRWYDIDFAGNTIAISSAIGVARDAEGRQYAYTKNPKNKTSKREFPLLPALRRVLVERYELVKRERGTVNGTWFVVGEGDEYRKPNILTCEMRSFTRKYNIREHFGKYPTLHSLRHNFATYGVNKADMDIASLTRIMGHASKAMTLDTYSTDMADAMSVAVDKLGKVLDFEGERPEDREDEDSRSD